MLEGVSPLITILSLSFIRLLVGYGDYRGDSGRDDSAPGTISGPSVARVGIVLTIGPNIYSLTG